MKSEKSKELRLIDIINKNAALGKRITNISNYDIAFKETDKERQYYILKEISKLYYNKHPHDKQVDEHKIIFLSRYYRKYSRYLKIK